MTPHPQANIVAVVGARLNSSRLPGKQLLDLAGRPLIARIFERLEHVKEINRIVLATTADDYNRPLVEWAKSNQRQVLAYDGDVNDLIGRVDTVVQAERPDIVVYVCGDSPLIEPNTVSSLLQAQLADSVADCIELSTAHNPKYIHEGFSIYSYALWQRIVENSLSPDDREHVGSAIKKFRHELNIRPIEDDPIFRSLEHRISVDTPSDYRFMSELYRRWYSDQRSDSIVSLKWVIDELKQDPALAAMNQNVRQKSVGEHSLPILLVCQAGPNIGLGHLARTLVLASALQDYQAAGVRLLIQSPKINKAGLDLLPHAFIPEQEDLVQAVHAELKNKAVQAVIFDLAPNHIPDTLPLLLDKLGSQGVQRIGIDSLRAFAGPAKRLDLLCIPGFFVAQEQLIACTPTPVLQGWEYYLTPPLRQAQPKPHANPHILILTGGSDPCHLGKNLPALLDQELPQNARPYWVRGPYSNAPCLPENPRLPWRILDAPPELGEAMDDADFALTVYGVSLFELLARGIPCVTFSPYGERDEDELSALATLGVARVAGDFTTAVAALSDLIVSPTAAANLTTRARKQIDGQGAIRLAAAIIKLCESGK